MANIMSLTKLRNNPSRSGFDLSERLAFTANAGEVLGVGVWECIPGDFYEFDTNSFCRTMPVQTSAYTRIKEYYDFVFVPGQLMWNKYNNWVSQMGKNRQTADTFKLASSLGDTAPNFTLFQLLDVYGSMRARGTNQTEPVNDMMGVKYSHNMRKLLWYLGYPDLEWYFENGYDHTKPISDNEAKFDNVRLNPFPLLAYHKAYSDYIRNSQWEESDPTTFNVNYITGSPGTTQMPISALGNLEHPMFQFHYANWEKDLFMGLLPNSQFGNSASVDLSSLIDPNEFFSQSGMYIGLGSSPSESVTAGQSPGQNYLTASSGSVFDRGGMSRSFMQSLANNMGLTTENLQSAFTILALRKAEAEQKFREITQSVHQDYQSQIKAHWDVNVSDAYSERSVWLGGLDGTVDISEVVNQNLADGNSADIQGKGVGALNGKVKFNCEVHGYLVCLYHSKPRLDYSLRSGISKLMSKTNVVDFAIPEFDRIGMDAVTRYEIVNDKRILTDALLGYAPRYYDYKTAIDKVKGAFVVGGLQDWVAPLSEEYLSNYLKSQSWSFPIMKVNPDILNSIFVMDAGKEDFTQEQFRNLVSFNIKSVRKLDRDGLPY